MMARRNARRDARSLPDELRILVLHGMIHLAGYDHETDRGQMQKLETALRRRWGLLERWRLVYTGLCVILTVFCAYLDLVYRHLGRVAHSTIGIIV